RFRRIRGRSARRDPLGRNPPSPFVKPFVRPRPLVSPLVRPKPFVSPFVRPRPLVRPFVRPSPFVNPFVRPRPFVRPFVRPSPFVRPFVRPRRPFVRPLSPFVLPAFAAPRRPRAKPLVNPFFDGVFSIGFFAGGTSRSCSGFGARTSGLSRAFSGPFTGPSSSWPLYWIATLARSSSSSSLLGVGAYFIAPLAQRVSCKSPC